MRDHPRIAGEKISVPVEIHGSDLPGHRCGPGPQGQLFENVHVGLWGKNGPVELVRGDVPSVRWAFAITVRRVEEDELDYGGLHVSGRRGERSLGLLWGTLGWDDSFDVFRAAKLRLADVEPALVEEALAGSGTLVCSLGLTDAQGYPRCASVRPPDLVWSVSA